MANGKNQKSTVTAAAPQPVEYFLKLDARITATTLLSILSEIGAASATIDHMEAHPVSRNTTLSADPADRLIATFDENGYQTSNIDPRVSNDQLRDSLAKLSAAEK